MTAPRAPLIDTFEFRLLRTDGTARRGEVVTPRGVIRTPAFMPVGTAATVKAVYLDQVQDAGADILLGNTYHLMLRPGAERIARLGGLHAFMGWTRPILTDSGGFQVMSLGKLRKMSEQGAQFQSHIDGAKHLLTPERSIEIQCLLGSDIQMQLDECIELPATHTRTKQAMELSLRWAERSKRAFEQYGKPGQALFGIVQGGTEQDLRRQSAAALADMDFPGYSIGGLAVGEGQETMLRVLEETLPHLPVNEAALSDGRRHTAGFDRIRRARHRHVRLRDADAERPPRHRLHLEWPRQSPQRRPRRGSPAARS